MNEDSGNRNYFLKRVTTGAGAGILSGSVVGLLESILVIVTKWNSVNISMLFYGFIMYSIVGILCGAGLGILFGIGSLLFKTKLDRVKVFSWIFTIFLVVNYIIIGRFRIYRDVLEEQPLTIIWNLVLLSSAILLFILMIFTTRAAVRSVHLCGLLGSLKIYLILGLITVCVSYIPILFNSEDQTSGEWGKSIMGNQTKPNVILIMIDTLRSDFLGCYGYSEKNISPNIDSLAKDGIVYKNMYAQSSYTKPSTATLLTSLYVSSHNTILKPDILPDKVETIAEVFKKDGYYTVGFADNIHISSVFNFQQGYIEYKYLAPSYFFHADESSAQLVYYNIARLVRERFFIKGKWVQNYYQPAEVVTNTVLSWLETNARDTKFFMYIHYMDPHDPYFEHPYNGSGVARVSDPNPPAEKAAQLRKLYAGEINYMDVHLGRLFEWLRKNNLYDNTVIALTADHGEEFQEHGGWWHGTTLYNEQICIPLILKLQNSEKAGTVSKINARTLDVSPTLIALSGIEKPEAMQGINLFAYSPEDSIGAPFIFSEEELEGNILKSLKNPDWKIILANRGNPRGLPSEELFDMKVDFAEKRNLLNENSTIFMEMEKEIQKIESLAKSAAVEKQETSYDETTKKRLQALGYVQ